MAMNRFTSSLLVTILCSSAAPSLAESYRGEMNSWGTSWMAQDADFGSVWKVSVTCGADDATSEFKFDRFGDWAENWGAGISATKNSTIGSLASGGGNLSFSALNNKRYGFNMNAGHGSYVVMETDNNPVSIARADVQLADPWVSGALITIQLGAAKSPQENIWVRYTTNSWGVSKLTAAASGSSTNYSATITATAGSRIEYYALTSTMPSNQITADFDLCTLRGKKSGTTNYSFRFGAGNAWHIPANAEPVGTTMRNPQSPYSNNAVYIYNGNQFQGAGNAADQSGGTLYHRLAGAASWTATNLSYDNQIDNNKYWKSVIPAGTYGKTNVVEYYLSVTYTDHNTTYIGTTNGGASSVTYLAASNAQAHPFSFTMGGEPGTEAAYIWHNTNRVNVGSGAVQCWAKIGYAQGIGTNRWVDTAAIYYTTNGVDDPSGTNGVPGASTMVQLMSFDHMEEDTYADGDAMWWVGTLTNLPSNDGSTIKYKIGAWKTGGIERFAEYGTSGQDNLIFSFSLFVTGAAGLTVNGVNADYTTTKFFIDEAAHETQYVTVVYTPEAGASNVQVFCNLNRRDLCDVDYTNALISGDGYADGIKPPDGNLLTPADTGAYFTAFAMTGGPTTFYWTGVVSRCGAYRLTARYQKNATSATNWNWYSSGGLRDHAIVVSPRKVLGQTMYELNTLTVEATDNTEAGRSTFKDLLGAADGDTDGYDPFTLDYLNFIQVNCLWFQPIHPNAEERKDSYTPGSPYATKNYFAVSKYYGDDTTEAGAMSEFTNFVAKCDAYTGTVGTINVMLDGVFNHTSWDAVFGEGGTNFNYCTNVNDRIGWFKPGWYALWTDYGLPATYYHSAYSNDIATAPDRGDFGKWPDVAEFYYGKYSALVRHNPDNNGDYLNEDDVYDFAGMTASNEMDLWRYMAYYTEFWLRKTGHAGTNSWVAAQDDRGIDGLRCDFGQGLPPQLWEYIINRTRHMKWNFIFMAETLDGGKPGYRSNRHFDVLNENLVFKFTQERINDSWALKQALEDRRTAYSGGAVLLNLTSHDEILPGNDTWMVASRYGAVSAVDGIPMIFYGQEQGIQNWQGSVTKNTGFKTPHEENFGKFIPNFKQWNQLTVWTNTPDYGGTDLAQWYGRVNWARHNSAALRSQNRWFLSKVGGGDESRILAAAKYENAYASPRTSDVVLAFALLLRNDEGSHVGASATYDLQPAWSLLGLSTSKYYKARNLVSSNAVDTYVWTNISGATLYNSGLWVSLNAGTAAQPITADGELVQFLKIEEDNLAPVINLPGPHILPVGAGTNFAVTATDPEGGIVTLTNAAVLPDVTFVGGIFSWTATPAFENTTNPVTFVATDDQGLSATNSTTITVPFDWNGNGIGDGWEWINFQNLTNAAANDNDGDGAGDYDEYIAGTQPTNGGSVFKVISVSSADGTSNRSVTVSTEPGRHYAIYFGNSGMSNNMPWSAFANTNLGIGSWLETSPTSTTYTFTDDEGTNTTAGTPANEHRFYRVKVQKP